MLTLQGQGHRKHLRESSCCGEAAPGGWEAAAGRAAGQPACWRDGARAAQSQGGEKRQNLCGAVLARLGNV